MADEPTFIICVNQPGYLPEMETYPVKGVESARAALIDEISQTATDYELNGPAVDEAIECAQRFSPGDAPIYLCDYAHEAVRTHG